MIEESERKVYSDFHKKLKKNGFYMIQYSVYTKVLQNDSSYKQWMNRLQNIVPNKGSIIIFKITEKQFQDLIYLRGERNSFETIVGGKELVVFKGESDD